MNKGSMDYNQYWSLAFDDMEDFVFLLDVNFSLIKANKSFIKFSGKTEKALIGKKCYALVHGTNEPFSECPNKKALETKKFERGEFYDPHIEKWLSVGATPVFDDDRKIAYSIHIATDITERKRAEEALKASEERFRSLVTLLPQTVYEADAQGRLTFVSNAAVKIFGYSKEEFEGMSIADLVCEEDIPRARDAMSRVMNGERVGTTEYKVERKSGELAHVLIESDIIRDERGSSAGMRGIVIDITDRKRAEEALKENIERIERDVKIMLGREMRVVEVKKEVNALLEELGRSKKYTL